MTSIVSLDVSAPVEAAPRLGRGSRRVLRRLAWVAALMAVTGVTLDVAATLVAQRADEPQPARGAAGSWVEVNRPIELFGLGGTEFARLPRTYRARRNVEGGGRRDMLAFGDPRAEAPYLGLSFYRIGREGAAPLPFAQDLGTLARESGLPLSFTAAPTPLDTRFGPFEVADLKVADPRGRTACLGFRSRPGADDALRVTGMMCGGTGRPLARDGLGCVIDRIDLVSAGEDVALQHLFVAAERRRGSGCAPSSLTAAGSRITWLDANASLPPLRGSSAGSTKD